MLVNRSEEVRNTNWPKSFHSKACRVLIPSRYVQVTTEMNRVNRSPPQNFAEVPETPPRPRSMAPPASRNSGSGGGGGSGTGVSSGGWGDAPLARALFAYLSSGENQLSFLEGDLIALMGECWMSERLHHRFPDTRLFPHEIISPVWPQRSFLSD